MYVYIYVCICICILTYREAPVVQSVAKDCRHPLSIPLHAGIENSTIIYSLVDLVPNGIQFGAKSIGKF